MTSRAGAAFGSVIGFGVGAVFGGFTVHAIKQGRASESAMIDGAIVGSFIGTVAGAAIGSGPSEPTKQSGTVGALPANRWFP
jgi:hypothetical protein